MNQAKASIYEERKKEANIETEKKRKVKSEK